MKKLRKLLGQKLKSRIKKTRWDKWETPTTNFEEVLGTRTLERGVVL